MNLLRLTPRPSRRRTRFDVAHVSSAHPWTDNRVHLREAATTARHHRTLLIAVDSPTTASETGVHVVLLPRRRRLARVVLNTSRAALIALRSGARIVHLHDPELLFVVPLLKVAGRRVVFDAHEIISEATADKDYVPRPLRRPFVLLARALVWFAGRACDHVVVATSLTARDYPAEKTTVVHNFPRLRDEELTLTPLDRRSPTVGFVGVVSEARGSRAMAAAALSPHFPAGWHLHVAGNAHPDGELSVFDDAVAAGTATIHGLLSPETARDLLLDARVGLVVLQPDTAYEKVFSTKLFEYMAAGVPIVCSDFPVWREVVERYDCALFVDPRDADAIARALARYADDPELLARHGANARRAAVEVFNWAAEEPALLGVYAKLGLPAS
jgi:glycosyltransferase involved in cell wall biosynthesis